jgi:hypothetical protein
MNDSTYVRWGSLAAIAVGLCSFLYGVLYIVLVVYGPKLDPADSMVSFGVQSTNFLLALGGLLGFVAVIAIFQRLRATSEAWARLALWFGMFGALLSALHGWSALIGNPTLADAFNQGEASKAAATLIANLPSATDPRGVGTFGLTGLFVLVVGLLMYRTEGMPRRLAYVALVSALLLELTFVGTVAYASGLGIAVARYLFTVAGPLQAVVAGPLFYIWIGTILRRTP